MDRGRGRPPFIVDWRGVGEAWEDGGRSARTGMSWEVAQAFATASETERSNPDGGVRQRQVCRRRRRERAVEVGSL